MRLPSALAMQSSAAEQEEEACGYRMAKVRPWPLSGSWELLTERDLESSSKSRLACTRSTNSLHSFVQETLVRQILRTRSKAYLQAAGWHTQIGDIGAYRGRTSVPWSPFEALLQSLIFSINSSRHLFAYLVYAGAENRRRSSRCLGSWLHLLGGPAQVFSLLFDRRKTMLSLNNDWFGSILCAYRAACRLLHAGSPSVHSFYSQLHAIMLFFPPIQCS